jgi:hypothetical protein
MCDERVDPLHGHLKGVDERDWATVYRLDVFAHGRHAATSSQRLEVSGHRVILPDVGAVGRFGFKIAL